MSRISVDLKTRTATVGSVTLKLATEYECDTPWIGGELPSRQLKAAWLKMSDEDTPMNPRLVGKPGVGKTTLAVAVAQELGFHVYLMQGTSDTRPEDLIVTPVIGEGRQISYVASPLVSAMITGGVCVLDEGNRMSEKSWASLAALLDHRRYVDSIIAGVRIPAHKDFRFVTTMNDDSSVYDLPEYIQSRLCPQIYIDFPDAENEARIMRMALPYLEDQLLNLLVAFLSTAHTFDEPYSVRDGIQIGKYAARRMSMEPGLNSQQALTEAIVAVLDVEALRFLPTDPKGPGGKGDRKTLRPV
jgi:MoxR-like ATPase